MKPCYLFIVMIFINCSINKKEPTVISTNNNYQDTITCDGVHIPLVPLSFSQTRLCVDIEEPQFDEPSFPLNFTYWELFDCMTIQYNELTISQKEYFLNLFDETLVFLKERKTYLNSYCVADLISNTLLKMESSQRINSLLFEFSQLDLCSGDLHDSHEIGWHVGADVSRMILSKHMTEDELRIYESQFEEQFRKESNKKSNLGECDYFPIKRKIWKDKLISVLNLNH